MCTACGFIRLHEFDCWLSFFAFNAVSVHVALNCIAVPKFKCKQCGCVRRKINNASTTRMY